MPLGLDVASCNVYNADLEHTHTHTQPVQAGTQSLDTCTYTNQQHGMWAIPSSSYEQTASPGILFGHDAKPVTSCPASEQMMGKGCDTRSPGKREAHLGNAGHTFSTQWHALPAIRLMCIALALRQVQPARGGETQRAPVCLLGR